MNDRIEWQLHVAEVQRLRARYAEDRLVRAVLALDLAIRRAARAMLSPRSERAARASIRVAGRTSCRS